MYMAISGMLIDDIISSGRNYEMNNDNSEKSKFLSTLKYHNRTPGLFKAELQAMRMIALRVIGVITLTPMAKTTSHAPS